MSARQASPRRRTNRLNAAIEPLESRWLMATFTVTSTANSGGGTLRQAILDANANAGFDVIQFNIAPGGPVTIAPTSALPTITGTANLNGTNLNTGGSFDPRVNLSGQNAPFGTNGLTLSAGITVPFLPVVQNLQVRNWFGGSGLLVSGSLRPSVRNVTATSNRIGIDLRDTGSATVENSSASGSALAGIALGNTSGSTVTGCTSTQNSIEGISIFGGSTDNLVTDSIFRNNSGAGVRFNGVGTTGNSVTACDIGWLPPEPGIAQGGPPTAAPNQVGVLIDGGAINNTVGGSAAADRNLIAGNAIANVRITDDGTSLNVVKGNYIGVVDGGATLAAGAPAADGVQVRGGAGVNTIGGTAAGDLNLISDNPGAGVRITGSINSSVIGNRIGTDPTGTAAVGNLDHGVVVEGGDFNVVRDCLISGNGASGIFLNNADRTTVAACRIGTNAAGAASLGNGQMGVLIDFDADNNVIGGDTSADRNIISANAQYGVYIANFLTNGNVVKGNYIGVDSFGTGDLGNGFDGVGIRYEADFNTIGPNNVISGNGFKGVIINEAGSNNNTIVGNKIGTDAAGVNLIPNATEGILIDVGANSNTVTGNEIVGNIGDNVISKGDFVLINNNYIGTNALGTLTGGFQGLNQLGSDGTLSGNILSGNAQHGLQIAGGDRNVVNGNYIGVNAAGTAALPNGSDGVALINGAQSNVIGGYNPADRNVISANGFDGIVIAGAGTNANAVRGNFIGTDVTGRVDLGNADQGVSIVGGAQGNTIGGSVAGARNIISGNSSAGIAITDDNTNFSNVWGNYIGTDLTGLVPMPNLVGVFVGTGTMGPRQSSIGGLASFEQQNLIAFNTQQGVRIDGDRTNQLRVNSISNNGGLGIDLNPTFSLNAPVLTSTTSAGGSTNVQGSITGTPSTGYIIDFYSSPMPDATGGVEGAIYIGGVSVFTNASGVAVFNSDYASPSALVTATATNNNTTSNFSNAVGQAVGDGGGGDGGGTGLAVVPTGVNTATLGVLTGAAITFNADPALTVAADTSIVVNPAASPVATTVSLNVSATLDVLTIKSRSTVTIANAAAAFTPRIKQLVTQDDGRLDLTDNALIVDYTGASPIDFIKSLITSGYNNGSWNGIGIASSTAASTPSRAIGYGEASNILNISGAQTATFAGRTVDATSVLVRFTRPGDANLDQQVNLSDYNRLASGFGTGNLWSQGNFNYDNNVNLSDYNLLGANFGLGLGDGVAGRPGRTPFGDTRITDLPELA